MGAVLDPILILSNQAVCLVVANYCPVSSLEELLQSVARHILLLRPNVLLACLKISPRNILLQFILIVLANLRSLNIRLPPFVPRHNHVSPWQCFSWRATVLRFLFSLLSLP